MPAHSAALFGEVQARFAECPCVKVIKGYVPQTFAEGLPDRIALAHIDLNQVPAEIAAPRIILPGIVPGGLLILDDFGWWGYRAQKVAEGPLRAEYRLQVLELPTSQRLVMIP